MKGRPQNGRPRRLPDAPGPDPHPKPRCVIQESGAPASGLSPARSTRPEMAHQGTLQHRIKQTSCRKRCVRNDPDGRFICTAGGLLGEQSPCSAALAGRPAQESGSPVQSTRFGLAGGSSQRDSLQTPRWGHECTGRHKPEPVRWSQTAFGAQPGKALDTLRLAPTRCPPAERDGPPFARKGIERWPSAPAGSYSQRPPKH